MLVMNKIKQGETKERDRERKEKFGSESELHHSRQVHLVTLK